MIHTKELEKLKIMLHEECCEADTVASQNRIQGKLDLLDEILPMVRSLEIENKILQSCKNKLKGIKNA